MDTKQFRFYSQTGNIRKMKEYLAELSDQIKVDHLKIVLQSPLRSDVLECLGMEIAKLPLELGTSLLVELLYSEEASVRNMAIELFDAFGMEALHALSLHLNDMDNDVRMFTVQALARLPYKEEVLQMLRKQLLAEKDINILTTIIEALGDLGSTEEDADAVRQILHAYPHPYLEFVAKRSLLRLGAQVDGEANEGRRR